MSYDTWKTTNHADNELGRSSGKPIAYRCFDCPWSGKGSIQRAQHANRTKHRTGYADDPRFTTAVIEPPIAERGR